MKPGRRVRALSPLIALLLLLAAFATPALAAPGAIQDLPGCRANTLDRNDDESTPDVVPLGFTAHVFDTSFSSVYVNNNGNITVDEPLGDFTPFDFRESGHAIFAPFFADVDTRAAGSAMTQYGPTTVGGKPAFCVMWDGVGYYNSHDDHLNRFQMLLVDQGASGIDLIFNYDSITWETGDLSDGSGGFGGTSAAAGYSAGDGDDAHSLMLPGSFANGGLLDSNPTTGLAGHSTAGRPAGSYLFALRPSARTGGKLTGTVKTSGGDPVDSAPVQLCRNGGACLTRVTNASGVYTGSNIPVGTYTLTAFPGPDSNNAKTTVTGVNVPGPPTVTTKNLTLGDPPPPPPEGTTVTSIDTTSRGIPVAYWEDPLTLSTQGCTGGTATYQFVLEGHIVRQGSMAEGPAGTYTVTMAAVAPDHGDGEITTHIVCQGGDPAQDTDFGIYIDPSGAVRDTAGNPVEDATVTLLRSASPDGPFFALPGGSALMSPSNRSNPTTTGPDGRFGWDVVAGYYIVTAAKDGCRSAGDPAQLAARTGVLTIPPAVTNVDLRLDCSPPPTGTPPTGTPPTATTSGPVIVPISAPAKKRSILKLGSAKLVKGKVLAVKLTCAKTAVKACKGKLTAKLGKKLVGSARYAKLKRGKSAVVKVKLSKAGRALIKKAKGKKVRLALSATAADAKGAGATAKRTVAVRR